MGFKGQVGVFQAKKVGEQADRGLRGDADPILDMLSLSGHLFKRQDARQK